MKIVRCAVLMLALACGGSDTVTVPSESLNGRYDLTFINGSPPPFTTYQDATTTVRLMSGELIIALSNQFIVSHAFAVTQSGQTSAAVESCSGAYTRNGNSLAFSEVSGGPCGGNYPGTWDGGNTITVSHDASLQAMYTR